MPAEGNYLWINKNLIELLTLWVIVLFPTWLTIGLDRFLFNKK
jgi:thiosulfate dehydrogenase (quinone) large subunit